MAHFKSQTIALSGVAPAKAPPDRVGGAWINLQYWAIAGLFLIGELPLLLKFGAGLWERPQYQFFPLMVVGAAYLAWEKWQELVPASLKPGSLAVTLILLILSLASLLIGGVLWLRFLAGVSTLLLLLALVWRVGGGKLAAAIAPSAILLAIIIPPPGHLDNSIPLQLRAIAVRVSCRVLDAIHVPNFQSGNVLEIPGRRLLVEEACSGINSLMAILGFSLLLGFWKRRRIPQIAVLVLCAVFFVMWANILRISGEAWLKVRWNIDVLGGSLHEMLGVALFLACVGLIASLDVGLEALWNLRKSNDRPADAPSPTDRPMRANSVAKANPGAPRRLLAGMWCAGIVFAAAGVFVQTQIAHAWSPPSIRANATFDLPAELAGWHRLNKSVLFIERPQTIARESHLWEYRQGNLTASIAIDYPFAGYHDLNTCYALAGWQLRDRSTQTEPAGSNDAFFSRTLMSKSTSEQGYLLFALLDEQNHWKRSGNEADGAGLSGMMQWVRSDASGPTYQIQALVQQYSPFTAAQQKQVDSLFFSARRQLAQEVLAQLENKP